MTEGGRMDVTMHHGHIVRPAQNGTHSIPKPLTRGAAVAAWHATVHSVPRASASHSPWQCSRAALAALLLVCGAAVPRHSLAAQPFDSTAMPSLELLVMEAGRASRAHPIRAVAPQLLCEPAHALVDSASLA